MGSVPRVASAVQGEAATLGTALAHVPALAQDFFDLYGAFWTSPVVPARIKEVARMRNARVTECGFCRNVRFTTAIDGGLDERTVDDITDDYSASDRLTGAEKAALRFTDALIHDPALMTPDAIAALRAEFSDAQIAELGLGVALFLALAKTLITLGLEPEAMARTVIATPGTTAKAA